MSKPMTWADWQNPPDPQRPPFPYHDKLSLSIKRHIPPKPYGSGYWRHSWPPIGGRDEIIKFMPSEWCLRRPLEETEPHPDPAIHSLHIIDDIACRDERGAQIVRCYLDEDESQICAAKIYDPLYYPYESKETGLPEDVTWNADRDYSREATAYEQLEQAGVDGKFTPKYFGSWTFNMTLNDVKRPVRLILMEYVESVSMYSLLKNEEVLRLSPEKRLEIFAQILEIEVKILFHHVNHEDLAPRNVLLVDLDIEAQTIDRILLIDFNQSVVYTQRHCQGRNADTDRPISPRYRYWEYCPPEFYYWVPKPHRSREEVFKGWLKTRWGNTEEFAGPTESLKRLYDFDEPVEFASPEQDDELPEFS